MPPVAVRVPAPIGDGGRDVGHPLELVLARPERFDDNAHRLVGQRQCFVAASCVRIDIRRHHQRVRVVRAVCAHDLGRAGEHPGHQFRGLLGPALRAEIPREPERAGERRRTPRTRSVRPADLDDLARDFRRLVAALGNPEHARSVRQRFDEQVPRRAAAQGGILRRPQLIEHDTEYRFRLVVPPLRAQHDRQIRPCRDVGGVIVGHLVRGVHRLDPSDRLAHVGLGGGVLAHGRPRGRPPEVGIDRLLLVDLDAVFDQSDRDVVVTLRVPVRVRQVVHRANERVHLCPHDVVAREPRVDRGGGLVEHLRDRRFGPEVRRARGDEQIFGEKPVDALDPLGVPLGGLPLLAFRLPRRLRAHAEPDAEHRAREHAGRRDARRRHPDTVAPHELRDPIRPALRPRPDRLVRQVAPQVLGQRQRRRVPPVGLPGDRLHRDPVELAAERRGLKRGPPGPGGVFRAGRPAEPGARRGGLGGFERRPDPPRVTRSRHRLVERCLPAEQLVEQHPDRVDVAPRVHIPGVGLLGAHVQRRADHRAGARQRRERVGQLSIIPERLGDAVVDHLADGLAVDQGHRDVRGLEVAVDHALRVRVLRRGAHLHHQPEPLAQPEPLLLGERRDRPAVHIFHREERAPRPGLPLGHQPRVEDPGDVRVLEQPERPPLHLEPAEHRGRVHARFDHLQRHPTLDRLALPRLVDDPEPALADLPHNPVRADRFGNLRASERSQRVFARQRLEELVALLIERQQLLDLAPQRRVPAAQPFERRAEFAPGQIDHLFDDAQRVRHALSPPRRALKDRS